MLILYFSSTAALFRCPNNFTKSAISILTRERDFSTETVRVYQLVPIDALIDVTPFTENF